MITDAQELLQSFDALSDGDKHRVVVEILRREGASLQGDVPETALIESADELFRALDAEEDAHAQR